MCDSSDVADSSPDKAKLIKNMMPLAAASGLAWVIRPGYVSVADTMGSKGQGVFQFRLASGTLLQVAVYSGEIYVLDLTTPTKTKYVSTANLTTASITLSATARVSFAVLNNKLVVSDGVNTPFQWDGTSGAAGLTVLTNCPVLYGPPTIYYSKIFGIKNSDRRTLVWSEENDPTLGYEAGGYNNAWDFTQQNQAPMTALVGTNEALYVFRATSITEITGAANEEFQTAGVRASVSESIGTTAPWSLIYSRRALFFLDELGRPHYFRISGEVIPIWQDFRETIKDNPLDKLIDAITVDDTDTDLIHFGVTVSGGTYPSRWLNYSISPSGNPVAAGYWDGYTFTAAAMFYGQPYGQSSRPFNRLVHLGPTDGKAYGHFSLMDGSSVLSDNPAGTPTAISCEFQTQSLAGDVAGEFYFDRVDWDFYDCDTDQVTTKSPSFYYVTERGTSTPQTPTAMTTPQHRQTVGVNVNARWLRLGVTNATAAQLVGVTRARARGVFVHDSPTNL